MREREREDQQWNECRNEKLTTAPRSTRMSTVPYPFSQTSHT